jgi:hypothetical protein
VSAPQRTERRGEGRRGGEGREEGKEGRGEERRGEEWRGGGGERRCCQSKESGERVWEEFGGLRRIGRVVWVRGEMHEVKKGAAHLVKRVVQGVVRAAGTLPGRSARHPMASVYCRGRSWCG